MDKLLQEIEESLNKAQYDRKRNIVQLTLKACIYLLPDRKKEICDLFDNMKYNIAKEAAMTILVSEICAAAEDKIIVPEYSQKHAAEQKVYVYVGTHWKLISTQVFYDFVTEACRKIGLSEVLIFSKYMCAIFEEVAFKMSRNIESYQPCDAVWINLQNCTVEINNNGTISTHEHRPEDFFRYCLPYAYDPQADCPLWKNFLNEVLPETQAQTLLGEYIGYCFTQNLKLEKMAVFYGSGANGKSVCLDVIRNLFGQENISEATLSSITNNPETRSMLKDKLVNISSESGKNLNAAVLKMLISGEPVEMRILYVGTKKLKNPPKLITAYNILPPIENSYGFRRRWLLFPFNKTIPVEKQDHALAQKLCTELSGILNWVLKHLACLIERVNQNNGNSFTDSPECNAALNEYFKSSNSVALFLDEACEKRDDTVNSMKDLYNSYLSYCHNSGYLKPFILKNFKKELIDWGAMLTVKHKVNYFNVTVDSSVYM